MTTAHTAQQSLDHAQKAAIKAAGALTRARLAQAEAERTAEAERDRLGLVAAQQRLDAYNRPALVEAERTAHRAFAAAVVADPFVNAYINWRGAQLWTIKRAEANNYDRHALGLPEVEVPSMPAVVPSYSEALSAIVATHVGDRIAALEQAEQDRQQQEVYGELPLTREEHIAREERAEQRRRAERAVINPAGYTVDVEGMSEQQRADVGVPAGHSGKTSDVARHSRHGRQ